MGHSLGGAVAVELAASADDVAGVIVDSGFTNLTDVVQRFAWAWPSLLRRITQAFDAGRKIALVRAPVLVVHGDADALVPTALGRCLYARASARKRFVIVRGGSHHDTHTLGQHDYAQALRELFGLTI